WASDNISLPRRRMIHAMGETHRNKIADMTSGLTTRCIKRPRASHALFNGCKMPGRMAAASAKAKATPNAHHRGPDPVMSGQAPTSTNTPANRAPKLRSEPSEAEVGVRLGPRTTATSLISGVVSALQLVAKRNRGTQYSSSGHDRVQKGPSDPPCCAVFF